MSVVGDGDQYQPYEPYPVGFNLAVEPGEVTTALCQHESTPNKCGCVHDWRVHWGNVGRKSR